jgi:hypothetical protein
VQQVDQKPVKNIKSNSYESEVIRPVQIQPLEKKNNYAYDQVARPVQLVDQAQNYESSQVAEPVQANLDENDGRYEQNEPVVAPIQLKPYQPKFENNLVQPTQPVQPLQQQKIFFPQSSRTNIMQQQQQQQQQQQMFIPQPDNSLGSTQLFQPKRANGLTPIFSKQNDNFMAQQSSAKFLPTFTQSGGKVFKPLSAKSNKVQPANIYNWYTNAY